MEKVYRFLAWTVVVTVAVVVLLRSIALRWVELPAQAVDPELAASIGPSLEGGDWVLLWRLTRPGKGDLVMCPDPDDPGNVVLGRIVALGGDTVTLDGQELHVNGTRPEVEYACTEQTFRLIDPDSGSETTVSCDMEAIDEKLHMRGRSATPKSTLRRLEKLVEPGKVFLLSDNRAHPFDSRHYGTLDRRTCTETVFFRLVSKEGIFDRPKRLTYVR